MEVTYLKNIQYLVSVEVYFHFEKKKKLSDVIKYLPTIESFLE